MVAKKLLVPKAVSYNPWARHPRADYRATKAFVPVGMRLPRGLSREQKWELLREMASHSSHFIKPLSARNKKIRALLEKHCVPVEKVIEDLKNGAALFEREGVELNSIEGKRIFLKRPDFFLKKLEEIAAKLTILEVGHGHLHAGNFAITLEKVILLDLARATVADTKKTKEGLTAGQKEKIKKNLNYFCDRISLYYFRTLERRDPLSDEWLALKKRIWDETIATGVEFADSLERKKAGK